MWVLQGGDKKRSPVGISVAMPVVGPFGWLVRGSTTFSAMPVRINNHEDQDGDCHHGEHHQDRPILPELTQQLEQVVNHYGASIRLRPKN